MGVLAVDRRSPSVGAYRIYQPRLADRVICLSRFAGGLVRRFKDGTRVKCRVLASLPSHQQQGGSKRRSRKGRAGDGNNTGTEGLANAGPVELSLRESRLAESLDVSEATKREQAPQVGSTAKVCRPAFLSISPRDVSGRLCRSWREKRDECLAYWPLLCSLSTVSTGSSSPGVP